METWKHSIHERERSAIAIGAIAIGAILVFSPLLSSMIIQTPIDATAQTPPGAPAAKPSAPTQKSVAKWLADKKDIMSGSMELLISDLSGSTKIKGKDVGKAIGAIQQKGKDVRFDGLANGWAKQVASGAGGRMPPPAPTEEETLETTAPEIKTSTVTGAFFNRSIGELSGSAQLISENEPSLAVSPVDGNKVIAAFHTFGAGWTSFECVVYRSSSAGLSWSGPVVLAPFKAGDFCSDPIASWSSDGTKAYVTYMSIDIFSPDSDIVISVSTDGGATFGAPVRIFDGNAGQFYDKPWMAADRDPLLPNNIYATATDFGPTFCRIEYSRSTDGGATWSTPAIFLAVGCGSGTSPFSETRVVQGSSVAADKGLVLVAFYDSLSNGWLDDTFAIRGKISTDGGATFSGLTTLFASPELNELPFFLCPDSSFHRVWGSMFPRADVRTINNVAHAAIAFSADTTGSGDQDCSDVYVIVNRNNGAGAWSRLRVSSTADDGGAQYFPDVGIQGDGTLHLMWMDGRDVLSFFPGATTTSMSIFSQYFLFGVSADPIPNMLYRIFYNSVSASNVVGTERVAVNTIQSSDFTFLGDYNDVEVTQGKLYYVYTERRGGDGGTDFFTVFDPEDDVWFARAATP